MALVLDAPAVRGGNSVLRRICMPVLLGLALLFVPTYWDMMGSLWMQPAHSHAPIILVIVAWLLWTQRAELLALPRDRPADAAGGIALASGLLLYVLGRSQGIALFEMGAHLPLLAGLLLMLGGWRTLMRFWFVLLLLVFVIPVPAFALEAMTGALQTVAMRVTETALNSLGYPGSRNGMWLSIGPHPIAVADAAAGFDSIVGLLVLVLLYLYFTASPVPGRIVLFLAAFVPMVVVVNVVRALVLVMLTAHLGPRYGQAFLAGIAGMMLFSLAFLWLLGLDSLLRHASRDDPEAT